MLASKNFLAFVRTVGVGLPMLALLTVASSCSRDALAPDCFEIDPESGVCLVPDPGGTDAGINCQMLPEGAVRAMYSFVPPVGGGSGNYSNWEATNLPPGLTINPDSGEISGVAEVSGNYPDITITLFDEGKGKAFDASCGPLVINESLNSNALRNEPQHCLPYTASRDEMIAMLGGGDGTDITCRPLSVNNSGCPYGDGNGREAPGITFNDSSCTHSGSISSSTLGTWVWLVEIEQSGFRTRVPFCANNDVGTYHDISLTVNNVAESNLNPGLLEYDPAAGLNWGNGSYIWNIEDPACVNTPSLCGSYGLRYSVSCSPFDSPFILGAGKIDADPNLNTGVTHQLTANGPVPAEKFETQPFVASFEITYCTADNSTDCDVDTPAFEQNAQTEYHFDVVGFPVAGNP